MHTLSGMDEGRSGEELEPNANSSPEEVDPRLVGALPSQEPIPAPAGPKATALLIPHTRAGLMTDLRLAADQRRRTRAPEGKWWRVGLFAGFRGGACSRQVGRPGLPSAYQRVSALLRGLCRQATTAELAGEGLAVERLTRAIRSSRGLAHPL
jgi:hypothetical protein